MTESIAPTLLTMDESLFYQLLDGPGTVEVEIIRLGPYFAPYVSFSATNDAPPAQHGAIVRGRNDLLAAETVDGVIGLLQEIAGGSRCLRIKCPDEYRNVDQQICG